MRTVVQRLAGGRGGGLGRLVFRDDLWSAGFFLLHFRFYGFLGGHLGNSRGFAGAAIRVCIRTLESVSKGTGTPRFGNGRVVFALGHIRVFVAIFASGLETTFRFEPNFFVSPGRLTVFLPDLMCALRDFFV